jgi:hypothetical protein
MFQMGGIVSGPIDPSLINKDIEFVFSEDPTHPMSQPSLFKGTLKSYQIKGVNWLINLYNQVTLSTMITNKFQFLISDILYFKFNLFSFIFSFFTIFLVFLLIQFSSPRE